MKISVKRIAIIVTVILFSVFIYQLYWLKGLYNTLGIQVNKEISLAMTIADMNELFIRVDSLQKNTDNYRLSVEGDMEDVNDTTNNKGFRARRTENNGLSMAKSTDNDDAYQEVKDNARTTELMAAYLQRAMHQAVDPFLQINIQAYDSLLGLELTNRNINGNYCIQLVNLKNDSIEASSVQTKIPKAFVMYDRIFDMEEEKAFRLWIENPHKLVIRQMAGILSTSVIIFGILLFLFRYLIKIIKRLQTEEELKTNFTNNMTHELKTPIAVSYAAVDALMVSDQPVSKERQNKYLTIAKEQMQYLTCLVEQILSMSRSDNRKIDLKPEKINLEDMINSLIEKAKLTADKEVEFKVNMKDSSVVADKLHLGNMLNNLIENGIKYSPPSVEITLSSERVKEQLVIKVTDNGPGIDTKYQSRIFDKFYRIPTGNRHNVKGYGLGLFYVREMAERIGGSVSVSSQPGKGTCFTLKLPQ